MQKFFKSNSHEHTEVSGIPAFARALSALYLIRPNPSVSGALFVFLLIQAVNPKSGRHSVYAALATFCAIGAAFALNDCIDVREDQVNNSFRPVACGLIDVRIGIAVYVLLSLAAVSVALISGSSRGTLIVAGMIIASSGYSLLVKRVWFLKNIFVASTISFIPVLANSYVDVPSRRRSLPLMSALFLWSLEKEILMDIRDVAGDARAGLTTLPMVVGRKWMVTVIVLVNGGLWASLMQIGFIQKSIAFEMSLAALHTFLLSYLVTARIWWVRLYLTVQVAFVAFSLALCTVA